MGHQQPPAAALFHGMKTVAGCYLGNLVKVGLGIERKQSVQAAIDPGLGI
jgi:hypothetical protein